MILKKCPLLKVCFTKLQYSMYIMFLTKFVTLTLTLQFSVPQKSLVESDPVIVVILHKEVQFPCWFEDDLKFLARRNYRSSILSSGSSQGLLFSDHAVVLCSCWRLLCPGFWPTVFENVLFLREVFVASCFPSFLFHPCEDELNTLAISICLLCWSSAFCTCFLTPGVSSGPALSCSLWVPPHTPFQVMGLCPHLLNSLWDLLWAPPRGGGGAQMLLCSPSEALVEVDGAGNLLFLGQ